MSEHIVLEECFNTKLADMARNKSQNSRCLTKERYDVLLQKVKEAKIKTFGKTPGDYQRLKRYDVRNINGEEKIICARSLQNSSLKYYVHTEEMFSVIHQAHLAIGHGGRDKMVKELQKTFKNITAEEISVYLGLCEKCSKRSKVPKKRNDQEIISRCHVDLINVHHQPDGPYNFILIYQDCATKFIQLRALKTNKPEEIADNLIDIFTIFKPPNIIYSTSTSEVNNKILEELQSLWKNLEITLFDIPETEEEIRSTNQDIENMLIEWLEENRTDNWAKGLRFVQLIKNEKYNTSIKSSAITAMLGNQSKSDARCLLQNDQLILSSEGERHVKMEEGYSDVYADYHKDEMMDI